MDHKFNQNIKTEKELKDLLRDKNVLYIATKNQDYIRVTQEIDLLQSICRDVKFIVSTNKLYAFRILKCLLAILFTSMRKYDIVFVGFMAQTILPFCSWRMKGRGKRIIITDFFLSIYDTLINDRKRFKSNSIIGKCSKILDCRTIKKSDYIVTDTRADAEYFIQEFNARQDQCIVLYMCADKQIYYPHAITKPVEYSNKFVVLYFGSVLPLQGVQYILEAASILSGIQNIHFIIIGPIDKSYEKYEGDTITYINWLPQKQLSDYIAFADLCLGGHFAPDIDKAKRTIPGKVYIYKSMKKKVILGDNPANRELYNEDSNDYYVEMGNSQQLAETILHIANQTEKIN